MKLKTRKSIAKRMKLTGAKAGRWGKARKIVRKAAGQAHFNARESGSITRKKRRGAVVTAADVRNIRRELPYA